MPSDLIESLVAWADDQPAVTDWFPGGFYNTAAPTGSATALPYLTFVQSDSRMLNLIGGGTRGIAWITVQLESRAALAEDARLLAGYLRDLLLSSAGALSWDKGQESGRYETDGESGELEDGMGPDGSDVWVHRIPIVFTTVRY